MGMNTAIKNNQILDHAHGIIGIEMMAASQALDLRRKLDDNKCSYMPIVPSPFVRLIGFDLNRGKEFEHSFLHSY